MTATMRAAGPIRTGRSRRSACRLSGGSWWVDGAVDSLEQLSGCCSRLVHLDHENRFAGGQAYIQTEVVACAGVDAKLRHWQILLETAVAEGVLIKVSQGVPQLPDVRN